MASLTRWMSRMATPVRSASLLMLMAQAAGVSFCSDKRSDCPAKAAVATYCADDPWAASTCPFSCGLCGEGKPVNWTDCADTDVHCGHWAELGECTSNPKMMRQTCPTSCGLCTPEVRRRPANPGGGIEDCEQAPDVLLSPWMTVRGRSDALPGLGRV